MVKVLNLPPKLPALNLINLLWDSFHSFHDLKHLLLTSWCHIPQHSFSGPVEFKPLHVRAGGGL